MSKKTGILLTNLGTPDAPTSYALRRYLQQFLTDKRVIEIPRVIWCPILYFLILPLRPFIIAKKYRMIWQEDGSPLLVTSQQQQQKLQTVLDQDYPDRYQVTIGMRYGQPSITKGLKTLQTCKKIVVLPLYPQYASATIGSTWDAVSKELQQWRSIPGIKFISGYYEQTVYIEAIARSIKYAWQKHGRGELLLVSFHGLPQKSVDLGDPYYQQCQQTCEAIAKALQLNSREWKIVFQSRFGKSAWLQPYCESTLVELAKKGVSTVDVICPGFAADCLETLEEMAETYAATFKKAGGKRLNYIPALNDRDDHIQCLKHIVTKKL